MKLSQTLLFFLAAFFNTVIAYSKPVTLHQLDERVKAGDEQALFAIASYFDSSGEALEYSGSGDVFYDFTESQIAKKIVRANCLFTTDEINITDYTTATEFQNFLLKNKTKILFSKPINAFLITPLVNRSVRFEMRIFSKKKKMWT